MEKWCPYCSLWNPGVLHVRMSSCYWGLYVGAVLKGDLPMAFVITGWNVRGRGPKAGPGEVAWWVAAVAIWSSVSFNQRHPAAAFSIFRSLLQRPVAETLFHSLAWYLGPMGNRQPSWERSIRLLPQTFEQQKNLSVAVVCSSRASWGQSQSANRFIYSELKGLSAFERNISVLQSPSYSFSLLQGRILHWFQRQQSNQQCVSVLQLRTGFPLHAATEQRYQFCVTSLPGHL